MEEPKVAELQGRKFPSINGNKLTFYDGNRVHDCADLKSVTDDIVCGRIKLSKAESGWIPFVWNHRENKVKHLKAIHDRPVNNSTYIAAHSETEVKGHVRFDNGDWHTFLWDFEKNSVGHEKSDME